MRRNRGQKGYRPKQAHKRALERRLGKAQPRIGERIWHQVKALIREGWSPEQVAGRIAMEQGVSISHEWIYQYIYADQRSGGNLYQYLRCQKVRRKRYGAYDRRGCIPNQVSIDDRPAIVDSKRRFGDWEGDTVIGKGAPGCLGDAGRAQVAVYDYPICLPQDGQGGPRGCRRRVDPVHRLGAYHHL